MLPLPDLAGFSTCLHCGHATRSEPEPPAPDANPDPPTVTITFGSDPDPDLGLGLRLAARTRATEGAKAARRRGSILAGVLGCLPIIVVVVVVGAIVVGLLTSEGGPLAEDDPSSDLYPSSGSALVLPGEPSGPAEVVLVATDNSGGESRRRLVRVTLGPDGGEERWRSEPLPDDVYTVSLASDGEQLYAGAGDEVWNLSLETGEERWRATVTDRVSTSCADCFEVVDGTLVVRTDDAYVTGFLPTSAEPRWSRRLLSPSGGMSVAGPWLVVVDDAEETSGLGRAITIEPRTGAVTKVVTPTCPASDTVPFPLDLVAGDEVYPVPGTSDVVARFGFGYGCLARWDGHERGVPVVPGAAVGPLVHRSTAPDHRHRAGAGPRRGRAGARRPGHRRLTRRSRSCRTTSRPPADRGPHAAGRHRHHAGEHPIGDRGVEPGHRQAAAGTGRCPAPRPSSSAPDRRPRRCSTGSSARSS